MPDPRGLTFLHRKKTLCIDVKEAYPQQKIPTADWSSLVVDDLKLSHQDIIEAHIHTVTGYLMIGFKEEEKMFATLEKLERGVMWTKVGNPVYGWDIRQALTTVRITNVSAYLDTSKVLEKLSTWGKVATWKWNNNKYIPHVKDGIMCVKMKIHPGVTLPPYIDLEVNSDSLQIFSDAAERVCYKCTKPGHIAAFCRYRTAAAEYDSSQPTWANIAGGVAKAVPPPRPQEVEKEKEDLPQQPQRPQKGKKTISPPKEVEKCLPPPKEAEKALPPPKEVESKSAHSQENQKPLPPPKEVEKSTPPPLQEAEAPLRPQDEEEEPADTPSHPLEISPSQQEGKKKGKEKKKEEKKKKEREENMEKVEDTQSSLSSLTFSPYRENSQRKRSRSNDLSRSPATSQDTLTQWPLAQERSRSQTRDTKKVPKIEQVQLSKNVGIFRKIPPKHQPK